MINAVVPLSMVTSASVPDASLVVIVNAPVNTLAEPKVIVASLALVTNVVVPEIVRTPL